MRVYACFYVRTKHMRAFMCEQNALSRQKKAYKWHNVTAGLGCANVAAKELKTEERGTEKLWLNSVRFDFCVRRLFVSSRRGDISSNVWTAKNTLTNALITRWAGTRKPRRGKSCISLPTILMYWLMGRRPYAWLLFCISYGWRETENMSNTVLCLFAVGPTELVLFFSSSSLIIYPLTARIAGAPQMISQPVSSIFPCSPLPSGT